MTENENETTDRKKERKKERKKRQEARKKERNDRNDNNVSISFWIYERTCTLGMMYYNT